VNVLVDTSVWVAHFKRRDEQLVTMPEDGWVVCHPHVVVEVACGTPPRRAEVVALLRELQRVPVLLTDELLALLQQRALSGRGCGFVDISLLGSALLAGNTLLWTLDKRLGALTTELGLAYKPAFP
jgi:predicted nucleic acid-binding protein